jgi:hypothetical protein
MAGKALTKGVVIEDPETGEPTYLEPGTVPDEKFAGSLGDHLFVVDEPDVDGPPPQSGRGSGVEAWREYADANSVDFDEDANRDEIIAACTAAGVPVE